MGTEKKVCKGCSGNSWVLVISAAKSSMRSDVPEKSLFIKLSSEFSKSWEFVKGIFSDSAIRGLGPCCNSDGMSAEGKLTDLSISSRKDQGESWVSLSLNKEPSMLFRFWMLLDTFSLANGEGSFLAIVSV